MSIPADLSACERSFGFSLTIAFLASTFAFASSLRFESAPVPQTPQTTSFFRNAGCRFGSILAPFSTKIGSQNQTNSKVNGQMPSCVGNVFISIFDLLYYKLRPPKPAKSLKSYWYHNTSTLLGIFKLRSILIPFWCQLGSIVPPKIRQHLFKNQS